MHQNIINNDLIDINDNYNINESNLNEIINSIDNYSLFNDYLIKNIHFY